MFADARRLFTLKGSVDESSLAATAMTLEILVKSM